MNGNNKKPTRTDIVSAIISLFATIFVIILAFFSLDFLVISQKSASFIVVFSIPIGVAIILCIAFFLYKKRTTARKAAISEMQNVERDFFSSMDHEISTLLSEKVI